MADPISLKDSDRRINLITKVPRLVAMTPFFDNISSKYFFFSKLLSIICVKICIFLENWPNLVNLYRNGEKIFH